jgi:hypothetical protein
MWSIWWGKARRNTSSVHLVELERQRMKPFGCLLCVQSMYTCVFLCVNVSICVHWCVCVCVCVCERERERERERWQPQVLEFPLLVVFLFLLSLFLFFFFSHCLTTYSRLADPQVSRSPLVSAFHLPVGVLRLQMLALHACLLLVSVDVTSGPYAHTASGSSLIHLPSPSSGCWQWTMCCGLNVVCPLNSWCVKSLFLSLAPRKVVESLWTYVSVGPYCGGLNRLVLARDCDLVGSVSLWGWAMRPFS